MKQQEQITQLKQSYIEYFKEVPVQRYAAMAIGRNEDTIILWKAKDSDFSDAIKMAEAEFIRSKMGKVKPEFALERLFAGVFRPSQEIEIKNEPPMPVHGTGTTTHLRERFMQMVKEEIRNGKTSDKG